DWRAPTDNEIEAERTSKPEKLWTKQQIKKLIKNANPTMAAMLHLAVNGAFGNSDLGRLKLAEVDGEYLRVPRGKNGRPRKCWLWAETRAAIDKAVENRPEPKDGCEELLFLTRSGGAWIDEATFYDGIGDEFRELKETCEFTGKDFQGIHFYALRHVFADVASNTGGTNADDVATKHVLGHLERAVLAKYRRELADKRIKAVCERVRKWLFGKGK
ncbi:MAG: tyrosine-type recombinase/integrase, partial [Planctomycetota bacterium]